MRHNLYLLLTVMHDTLSFLNTLMAAYNACLYVYMYVYIYMYSHSPTPDTWTGDFIERDSL